MVYSAVRQMGGDVTIESQPGNGTTVRLLLPALDARAASGASAAEASAPAEAKAEATTLLYVEDEMLVRLATVDLLVSGGYAVVDAANAERALTLLDEHPEIMLMVTDVGLPGMNGHALAAEARRRRPGLKVVFLTGYDRERFADRAGDAQKRDADMRYLDKPYEHAELFRALDELLAR
jgi:CheY-like chemotaxis protein